MPAFRYVALNADQKKLSGVIEAPDEAFARKKLNDLGLSIIALETMASSAETSLVSTENQKPKFEFGAMDKNGKIVTGTIASPDALSAYIRLIDEYQLKVDFLVAEKLVPSEKEIARKLGVQDLQAQYEKKIGKKTKEKASAESTQQKERQELLEKVDFTTTIVQNFLNACGTDLKPEERDTIRSYLNQLIRIKDSTNLDHIRTTCERMIDHIQKKELFLHEEEKLKESTRLRVETKSMLEDLKKTGLSQDIDVVKTVMGWQQQKFLRPVAEKILAFLNLSHPEVQKLRRQIKTINRHIMSYLKIFVFGQSSVLRREAWQSIGMLREEKKRIKLQIDGILLEAKKTKSAGQGPHAFWDELGLGTGTILGFYLFSYFLAYPFTVKQFPYQLPKNFFFYQTDLVKGATLLFFMLYACVTMRNLWFSGRSVAPLIILPVGLFGFLLITLNLL